MEFKNLRVETFDLGEGSKPYTMILCDVIKEDDQIITDVSEYIVLNGDSYELEETNTNLDAHEDRLNQEEKEDVKTLFVHLVNGQKSISDIEKYIKKFEKDIADLNELIEMQQKLYKDMERIITKLDKLKKA